MNSLYDYIIESIFDDNIQMDKIDSNSFDHLFNNKDWYIGKDNKTIFSNSISCLVAISASR